MIRCALYLRLSREDGEGESNSIQSQRMLLLQYMKEQEQMECVGEWIDDGISGSHYERPGFQAMMGAAQRREFDCILCKDLSRLGREYIQTGYLLREILPRLGIRLIAVADHYDSEDTGFMEDSLLMPVMSLMNGVDSEEIIAEKIDKSHILYSFIKVASQKKEDGYHFDPETTVGIYFGELQQPYESERVKAVNDIFENTGLHWIITDDIQAEIWGKFKLNVCNNLPQAILGVGVGCYEDSEHMAAIREGLRAEVEAVAKAKGIDLSMINAKSGRGSAVKASARYSTLQDIDSGRHTEIDMFSGAMMRMGKELEIPTPYNEYTYHMIKALEEKNDGVFEYQGENDRVSWSK